MLSQRDTRTRVKSQDFGHTVLESREAMSNTNQTCRETQRMQSCLVYFVVVLGMISGVATSFNKDQS